MSYAALRRERAEDLEVLLTKAERFTAAARTGPSKQGLEAVRQGPGWDASDVVGARPILMALFAADLHCPHAHATG